MADERYYLTQRDRDALRELHAWRKHFGPQARSAQPSEELGQTPDVLLVRTPKSGIPGLSRGAFSGTGTGTDDEDDIPSTALCDVYRLNGTVDAPTIDEQPRFQVRVWNLSPMWIGPGLWITAIREKFGRWIAAPDGQLIKGVMNSALYPTGGASMSVYYYNGATTVDTGVDLTVWGWLLDTGQTVAVNRRVIAAWCGGLLEVIAERCPA